MKLFLSILLVITTLSLSGCQGSNSDSSSGGDTSSSVTGEGGVIGTPPATGDTNANAIIVLNPNSSVLTKNSESVTIIVKVFDSANNAFTSGKIKGTSPDDALLGRDVGSFSENLSVGVDVINGIATFSYTAPSDLDTNTSNLVFGFYHDSNTSNVLTYTFSISPESNQTSSTEYFLTSSDTGNINIDLESTKSFLYSLVDQNGVAFPDANVTSLIVTSENTGLVLLKDNSSNAATSSLTVSGKSTLNVNIVSNKKSGLVPIRVDAIFNTDSGEQNLSKTFNLVVFSGPPTAAAFGFTGNNSFNATTGLYTDELRLFITDKYSNQVNSNPAVALEMITGYATSSAATTNSANYLYYETNATFSSNSGKGQITALSTAFSSVDLSNDFLIVFGSDYKLDTFGKWDIDTIPSTNVLDLSDDFNSSSTASLSFAVGHNLKSETCSNNSVVASVQVKTTNIVDDNGILIFEIIHDDYMVGKSVMVAANFLGGHNNINTQLGYAEKVTLLGTGLVAGSPIQVTQGSTTGIHPISIYVNDSPTGRVYQNSNFSAKYDVSAKDTNVTVTGTSMVAGITDCSNGGAAYVEFTINGVAGGDGEISLSDLRIGSEF